MTAGEGSGAAPGAQVTPGPHGSDASASKPAAKKPGAKKPPAKKPGAKKPGAPKQGERKPARKPGGKASAPRGAGARRPGAKTVTSTGSATTPSTTGGGVAVASKPGTRSGRPAGRPRRAQPRWVLRLFATPNIEGPRVRLGIVWFLFALPAVYAGPVPTAALFGLHALIAALQGGQAWRREGYRPSRLLAGPAALALPVLAIDSYTTPAVVLVVLPFLALAVAIATPRRKRRTSALATAGITLRCAVPAGVAAAGMVYTTRLGVAPAMVFFALLTAHDIGSFTYGAEASSPITGIFWGALFTFGAMAPVFCFQLPPFDGTPAAWVFAGLVAILGPLGQIAASASLPTAATWVPALRRLDSYIFAAPFWAFSMWSYLT